MIYNVSSVSNRAFNQFGGFYKNRQLLSSELMGLNLKQSGTKEIQIRKNGRKSLQQQSLCMI